MRIVSRKNYRTGRKFRGDKISCFVLASLNSNVQRYLFSRYSLLMSLLPLIG